jgi:chromatin assembly factor 1 subunit A
MAQVQNEILYYQEKERLEKKLARAEREQKEKEKSQSIMAKFFAKPKASSPAKVAVAGPSKLQTDFERTFKPFVLGKDKVLAPANWFLAAKRRKTSSHSNRTEVILIDCDDKVEDDKMQEVPSTEELNNMSPQGMFSRFCFAKFFILDLQIVCMIFF